MTDPRLTELQAEAKAIAMQLRNHPEGSAARRLGERLKTAVKRSEAPPIKVELSGG
jgi:hypothetical protein